MVYLFNQSIALGRFPDSWAIAAVTPIPKADTKDVVNDWRPISIIPLIGKMMEKLCTTILTRCLEDNGILCEEQYGFRQKRSTSLAIFNYVKCMTEEMNKKKMIVSIYIDFALALNFINHIRLISKLSDMGVPKILVSWIESYLGHRQICTKLNYCILSSKPLL